MCDLMQSVLKFSVYGWFFFFKWFSSLDYPPSLYKKLIYRSKNEVYLPLGFIPNSDHEQAIENQNAYVQSTQVWKLKEINGCDYGI